MRIYSIDVLKNIVVLFLFVIVIAPSGTLFHLKETLFVLLMLCYIFCSIHGTNSCKVNISIICILYFVLLLPIYGIIISLLRQSFWVSSFAWGQLKSFVFVLLLPVFCLLDCDWLIKMISRLGLFVVFIIFVCYIVGFVNQSFFEQLYDYFVVQKELALISVREIMGIPILAVFYKTSPIIFFSLIYFLYDTHKWSRVLALLCFCALFFTGSRMPMLGGIFIFLYFLCDKITNSNLKFLFVLLCLLVMMYLGILLGSEIGEASNFVKYANLSSYLQALTDNTTLFLGKGLGSVFYALGREQYVTHSELTYFDIIRTYGLLLGGVFLFLVFLPTFFLLKRDIKLSTKHFLIAYLCYVILAGTNPLLISSTGMSVCCLGWALIFAKNK